MLYSLYLITSSEGMVYLGSTKQSVTKRLVQHYYDARRGINQNPLYADMRRLGVDKFTYKVLKLVDVPNKRALLTAEMEEMGKLPATRLYNRARDIAPTHATRAWTGSTHSAKSKDMIRRARLATVHH